MAFYKRIRDFLFPTFNRKYLIRVLIVALCAYVLFAHICLPFRIRGRSMEPTYRDGGVNFCWRPRYLFSEPERFDVVAVRLAGKRVMLLKRVVALAGETIEIRNGKILVDGKEIREDYVRYPCDWNLTPREVKKNSVYVVGDNRNIAMGRHDFGQTSIHRIIGAPLW